MARHPVHWSSRRKITSTWCPCIPHYLGCDLCIRDGQACSSMFLAAFFVVVPLPVLPGFTLTWTSSGSKRIGCLRWNPGWISTSCSNWVGVCCFVCEGSFQGPICSAWGALDFCYHPFGPQRTILSGPGSPKIRSQAFHLIILLRHKGPVFSCISTISQRKKKSPPPAVVICWGQSSFPSNLGWSRVYEEESHSGDGAFR